MSREDKVFEATAAAAKAVYEAKNAKELEAALLSYRDALEAEASALRFASYSQSNPGAVMARRDNARALKRVEERLDAMAATRR